MGMMMNSVRVTSSQWDATRLTQELVMEGMYNAIISVGGDGTHNEVVNGIVRAGGLEKGIDFGTLSIGSGSDFDKSIFSQTALSNVEKLELYATGPAIRCDLGLLRCATADSQQLSLAPEHQFWTGAPTVADFVQRESSSQRADGGLGPHLLDDHTVERFFVNISGCGIGGAVCHVVNSSSKILGGFTTFCYATVRTSLTWVNPAVRWKQHPTDEWTAASVYMFLVGNGRYQGGGMKPVPQADVADGLLDLVVIRDFGFHDVLKIPSIYTGTHFQHRPRVFGERLRHVYIEPLDVTTPVWIECDGETPGKLPAAFHLLPQSLSIIVPPAFIDARLAPGSD
jgi:diacylglycerol kinase family enzyme